MSAVNIIKDLQVLKFRGLEAPCESTPYRGGHSQAERLYPFIDGAGHDHTGRLPYQFQSTKLHFNNTIKPHDWYPSKWNQFREALENGDSGDLDHPDLGTVRVRVLTFDVSLSAKNQAGIEVDVTWTETVDNLDERVVFLGSDVSIKALAEAVDSGMASLGLSYPDGKSTTSCTELAGQIEGAVFSASLTVGGLVNQGLGIVTGIISAVEKINDHVAYALRDNLIAFWSSLKSKQQDIVAVQRATRIHVTASETTLDQIARETGTTISELVALNLKLVSSPSVPKETRVVVYTGGVSISSPLRAPGP